MTQSEKRKQKSIGSNYFESEDGRDFTPRLNFTNENKFSLMSSATRIGPSSFALTSWHLPPKNNYM